MINLAVINKKDLIKYLIKLAIIIIIIIVTTNLFSKKEKVNIKIGILNQEKLIACLDETIPGIKQLNTKEEQEENRKEIEPLKLALRMELEMMDSMILKENDTTQELQTAEKANEEDKVEHAQIGLSTEVIENNVPNKFTNSYNGVEIKIVPNII